MREIRLITMIILAFLVLATVAGAGNPGIEPFCGVRFEPSYDPGNLIAYSDNEYWGPNRVESDASATRYVFGVEVYPGGKPYEERTIFLSTGIIFGNTSTYGSYDEPDEYYYFDASSNSQELGGFIGVGMRQRAVKLAFNYYFISLDKRTSTYSQYNDVSPNGWRSSVEEKQVNRHLFAPSVTATIFRLLDIRLEGWYELDYTYYDAAGSFSAGGDLEPVSPWPYSENSHSDDFSYAIQVTLNLAQLVRLF